MAAYVRRVIRPNIHLTEAEEVGLDATAEAEGSTRSDVVRSIVDRALNNAGDADTDALVVEPAPDPAELARERVVDVPEPRID